VIITDGDPTRQVSGTEKYVFAGLRRASKLFPDGDTPEVPLDALIGDLVHQGASGDPTVARLMAANGDVFVGLQTLEVDITPLLSAEMIEAYSELVASATSVRRFRSAVEAVANGDVDTEDRDELLRRIDNIGKGRFAQRLAAHIDVIDPSTLRAAITYRDTEMRAGLPSSISPARFMGVGSYGYLFAALDRVSWMVRGRSLRRRTVRARGQEQQ
jgi:putative ATP-dependent endonuclease of OLD family